MGLRFWGWGFGGVGFRISNVTRVSQIAQTAYFSRLSDPRQLSLMELDPQGLGSGFTFQDLVCPYIRFKAQNRFPERNSQNPLRRDLQHVPLIQSLGPKPCVAKNKKNLERKTSFHRSYKIHCWGSSHTRGRILVMGLGKCMQQTSQ